jgi:hypothetical protein
MKKKLLNRANNIFYIFEDGTYIFYECTKLEKVNEKNIMTATRIESHGEFLHALQLSHVGVHRYHGMTRHSIRITMDEVSGLAMRVKDYLISVPNETIEEIT